MMLRKGSGLLLACRIRHKRLMLLIYSMQDRLDREWGLPRHIKENHILRSFTHNSLSACYYIIL